MFYQIMYECKSFIFFCKDPVSKETTCLCGSSIVSYSSTQYTFLFFQFQSQHNEIRLFIHAFQ